MVDMIDIVVEHNQVVEDIVVVEEELFVVEDIVVVVEDIVIVVEDIVIVVEELFVVEHSVEDMLEVGKDIEEVMKVEFDFLVFEEAGFLEVVDSNWVVEDNSNFREDLEDAYLGKAREDHEDC